jgi:sulfite reductase (ferredoxin)
VAGIAPGEQIDPTPAIAQIVKAYIGDPTLSNLPRKLSRVISWQADVP